MFARLNSSLAVTGVKTEELLLDIRQPGEFTDDLFAVTQRLASGQLMSTIDKINDRFWGEQCGLVASPTPPIGGCAGKC